MLVAAALAPAARADDASSSVATAKAHAAEDSVVHTAAEEQALGQESRTATASDAAVAAQASAGPPNQTGRWGAVMPWNVVGVHEALLPNGKVLVYDSVGDNATESYPNSAQTTSRAMVFDPQTGSQTPVAVTTGVNIFCSGLAHLMNGQIFIAGGNKDQDLHGIKATHVFDGDTGTLTRTAEMTQERWYPTVTPLGNGEMLIVSGQYQGAVDTPEVRGTDGRLRDLSAAQTNIALYPWMDVAPDGKVFNSGPDPVMRELDPSGNGQWQDLQDRDGQTRDYGGHALYDIGKLLVAGGGPSLSSAETIDINGATPKVAATAPLHYGRRQNNLTVLADGSVLATGGNSSGATLVDKDHGVYAAERWDPATGRWSVLDSEDRTRQYHSTALLLPDGRVLSAGGGVCGTCDDVGYLEKNAQIFSPPYLYGPDGNPAPRPTISSAPTATPYGATFKVTTPDAGSVSKVALLRLGAVTHDNNMEQRYVPLKEVGRSGSTIRLTSPANANIAPPGVYMLFVVNSAGVPSVAKMVTVSPTAAATPNAAPSVTVTSPANGTTATAPASIPLAAAASDPDGSVVRVEFYSGATKLGEGGSMTLAGVGAGSYTVTAVATDDDGARSTSAPVSFTVRPAGSGAGPGLGTAVPGGGGSPTAALVRLTGLKVVGTTSRSRKLVFTAPSTTTVTLTLARRVGKRWVAVHGKRAVKVRRGRREISLREPWAGHSLKAGRYRIAVSTGKRVVHLTFTIRKR